MTPLDPERRESVLRVASTITTTSSAIAVVINASILTGWLENAPTAEDQDMRHAAMLQHHRNITAEALADDRGLVPGDDNPDAFLEGAKVLYAFLTAPTDTEGT